MLTPPPFTGKCPGSRHHLLAPHVSHRRERKGQERKEKDSHMCNMEKKTTFVGLEPTSSAIRADVLIQLD
jgi:hypothetical protein